VEGINLKYKTNTNHISIYFYNDNNQNNTQSFVLSPALSMDCPADTALLLSSRYHRHETRRREGPELSPQWYPLPPTYGSLALQ
jgi:hypothetical protein